MVFFLNCSSIELFDKNLILIKNGPTAWICYKDILIYFPLIIFIIEEDEINVATNLFLRVYNTLLVDCNLQRIVCFLIMLMYFDHMQSVFKDAYFYW